MNTWRETSWKRRIRARSAVTDGVNAAAVNAVCIRMKKSPPLKSSLYSFFLAKPLIIKSCTARAAIKVIQE
jgi:hypothetical protein